MSAIDGRALKIVWTVFLFALVIFLTWEVRQTLIVFTLAFFLAHLLSPAVTLVERFVPQKAPRVAVLLVVYVSLLAIAISVLIPLVSLVGEQASALAAKLPEAIKSDPLGNVPLPSWLESWRPRLVETLRQQMQNLDEKVLPTLTNAGVKILSGIGNVLPVILIPILSFFSLKDGLDLRNAFVGAFPLKDQVTASAILGDLHVLLQQYTRALVVLAAVTFLTHVAFLSLMGVPYPILLAGIAAILEFIPVVGPLTAAAVMMLVVAFAGFPHILWILVFLGVYRVFQDYVLNPYLMSAGVEVHPLLVLFGVLAGEQAAGIPGMFFAVPLIAALRAIIHRLREADSA